jgi:hypothetical protein
LPLPNCYRDHHCHHQHQCRGRQGSLHQILHPTLLRKQRLVPILLRVLVLQTLTIDFLYFFIIQKAHHNSTEGKNIFVLEKDSQLMKSPLLSALHLEFCAGPISYLVCTDTRKIIGPDVFESHFLNKREHGGRRFLNNIINISADLQQLLRQNDNSFHQAVSIHCQSLVSPTPVVLRPTKELYSVIRAPQKQQQKCQLLEGAIISPCFACPLCPAERDDCL